MRISIEHNGTEVNEQLKTQIRTKVGRLEHYYENIIDAIVYLHEERERKEVQIKLIVKEDTLFVKENNETFLNALDDSVKAMQLRLIKYKEKTLKNI
jgi:putative sigma-54 modulation protein